MTDAWPRPAGPRLAAGLGYRIAPWLAPNRFYRWLARRLESSRLGYRLFTAAERAVNGSCEVCPGTRCVWLIAWERAERHGRPADLTGLLPPADNRRQGESAWVNRGRGEPAFRAAPPAAPDRPAPDRPAPGRRARSRRPGRRAGRHRRWADYVCVAAGQLPGSRPHLRTVRSP